MTTRKAKIEIWKVREMLLTIQESLRKDQKDLKRHIQVKINLLGEMEKEQEELQ